MAGGVLGHREWGVDIIPLLLYSITSQSTHGRLGRARGAGQVDDRGTAGGGRPVCRAAVHNTRCAPRYRERWAAAHRPSQVGPHRACRLRRGALVPRNFAGIVPVLVPPRWDRCAVAEDAACRCTATRTASTGIGTYGDAAPAPRVREREMCQRLRLAEDCIVLRGPVDRESVALLQVTMPEARTHSQFVIAGWRLL